MTWHIHEHVMRAVIDNRIRGVVTGRVWVAGRLEPVWLQLQGNAWSDLAGCLILFDNSSFRPDPLRGFSNEQRGVCGDVTSTRGVRNRMTHSGEKSAALSRSSTAEAGRTGIYVEWFSERNGRVVIELMTCRTWISERVWHPTTEEQMEPAWCNLGAIDALLRARAKL